MSAAKALTHTVFVYASRIRQIVAKTGARIELDTAVGRAPLVPTPAPAALPAVGAPAALPAVGAPAPFAVQVVCAEKIRVSTASKGVCIFREPIQLDMNALCVPEWCQVVGSSLVYKKRYELLVWLWSGRAYPNVMITIETVRKLRS